jgi:predicted Zn-dependent peptidase
MGTRWSRFRSTFRGGARNITEQNAGIEEVLLDVATQGTRKYSKSQINRELSRMGTVVDSAAGYDFSVIAMRCVRSELRPVVGLADGDGAQSAL